VPRKKGSKVERIGVVKALGELEVEIMDVVWDKGTATVQEVFEALYPQRRLAYTTIMTVMSRLAAKGTLEQDRRGIAYVYKPRISREELAASVMQEVVDRVLGGRISPYLADYLKHGKADSAELAALRELIDNARPSRPN
jgi:predicted transcriptional regulator